MSTLEYAKPDVRPTQPKWMTWTGWIVGALPALFMLSGVVIVLAMGDNPQMKEGTAKLGWSSEKMPVILILEALCVILYLIPQTAVLGAILLAGYLGGAIASHVRISDPQWPVPLIMGILVWLGLFLRDARVRALIPLRR